MQHRPTSLNLLLVASKADAELAGALRALGHRVTVAGDSRAAAFAVDRDQYDALLLDRALPETLALLRSLRDGGQTLPVIVIAASASATDTIEGLDAGADDYVVAPLPEELEARLRAVLRGRGWQASPADMLRAGDIVVSPGQFRAWRGGTPIDLARMELNLLAELARRADTVVTRAVLVERVWGLDVEPDTNIVDVHIRRLRMKLAVEGWDDPIVTFRGIGYMLRG